MARKMMRRELVFFLNNYILNKVCFDISKEVKSEKDSSFHFGSGSFVFDG